ncbi:MAG: protein-disulfide reductase DsbD domain-containing protein [Saprospiraceae bacterium]
MKHLILLAALIFQSVFMMAQEKPVKWTSKAEKISDTEYKLIIEGEIQPKWNIYSQFLESQDGPVATTLSFITDGFEIVGKAEESGHKKEGFDEMFGMNVVKFAEHITFTQKVKISKKDLKKISLTVNYMSCNNEVCLPPRDEKISIVL